MEQGIRVFFITLESNNLSYPQNVIKTCVALFLLRILSKLLILLVRVAVTSARRALLLFDAVKILYFEMQLKYLSLQKVGYILVWVDSFLCPFSKWFILRIYRKYKSPDEDLAILSPAMQVRVYLNPRVFTDPESEERAELISQIGK